LTTKIDFLTELEKILNTFQKNMASILKTGMLPTDHTDELSQLEISLEVRNAPPGRNPLLEKTLERFRVELDDLGVRVGTKMNAEEISQNPQKPQKRMHRGAFQSFGHEISDVKDIFLAVKKMQELFADNIGMFDNNYKPAAAIGGQGTKHQAITPA
jgi:hypothetical protein